MSNDSISPISMNERTMNLSSTFFLWLGSNVVVTTVFSGMLFIPDMTYLTALTIILLGTLIGTIPLVLMGNIGTRTGLPTMILARGAFGHRGAVLPTIVNTIILIGWSWIQAYMAALSLDKAIFYLTGYSNINLFTILTEALVVLITIYGHQVIEKIENIIVTLMVVLVVIVFGYMFVTFDFGNLIKMSAIKTPTMTISAAFDVVVATAFSWMLMVSDHNRFCQSEKSGIVGTYFGFSISTTIAMVLGATVAGFSILGNMERTYDPTILIGQNNPIFGFVAAAVIFISVVSTNVMVLYSATTSFSSIFKRQRFKTTVLVLGIICIAGALLKEWLLTNFQGFLLMIGSLFIPVIAITLVDYYILKRKQYDAFEIISGEEKLYWYSNGINYIAYISFIIGAGFAYYFSYVQALSTGTTILTFLITSMMYFGLMKVTGKEFISEKSGTSRIS
jgi:NCS1 family nucleobase:cation symporter-1